jgi:hypothetical protein
LIASLVVVVGIRKAVVARTGKAAVAGMDKAVVVGIRKAAVAGADTDNILEEAALAVDRASSVAIHSYRKTLTRKQRGCRI